MKKNLLLFAIVLSFPFGGLSQTYNYSPNLTNIPYLTQSGDVHLGLGWGRGLVMQSLEIQAAYSPMRHLAIMANYLGDRQKNVRKQIDTGTDYYLWEAGVGVYEKLPKGSASVFAGYGGGELYNNFEFERVAEFNLQRWFIQPGINYRSNFFQAGIALRLSHLTFKDANISYSIEEPYLQYIKNIEQKSPMFLPELGLQIGMRLKPVTISLNIVSIFPDTENWNFSRLNTGLCIALDLNVKKPKG